MRQKTAQIIKSFSPLNWWSECVGQIVSILDTYEPTGYVKIRVVMKDHIMPFDHPYGGIGMKVASDEEMRELFYDPHYQVEGWIDPQFLRMIETPSRNE